MLLLAAPLFTLCVASIPVAPLDDASVVTYLQTLDTVDAAPGLALASPLSAAWRYVEHQVALEEANRENGYGPTISDLTANGNGAFELCRDDGAGGFCSTFADFTTDAAGLIQSFTVDGTDITGRLGDPTEPLTFGPVTAHVRSSYRTVTNDNLVITVEVTSSVDVDLMYGATYIDATGTLLQKVEFLGPATLYAGANATVAMVFTGVSPGGRLIWGAFTKPDYGQVQIDLSVPGLLLGAELAMPTTIVP